MVMKNKKTIVKIYYGPRKGFNNKIKNEKNKEEFSLIVQEYDKENKSIPHYAEGQPRDKTIKNKRYIENLIINSDDYFTITESATQNINPILNSFNIEKIFVQNPPTTVLESLQKNYKKINIECYDYKKIDLNTIKVINRNISNKIIGQDNAIHKLLISLLSFVKFTKDTKPIVLMFYGPSGVGKTETAKYLSKKLGGQIFYKQFSMFQNNEFSNYLFGGLTTQNSFAKELLERNSNVILLDEFDKAHPHFYSAFYQLFDEGIYIDKNYCVKLKNSIIICTSNYKSEDEIREKLGDPIYYRISTFIKFKELEQNSINRIIDLIYDSYIEKLREEDKNIIKKTKYNNLSVKDSIKQYAYKLKNVRNIDNIIKETILDILLENELMKN